MSPIRLGTPDDIRAFLVLLKDGGLPYQDIDAAHLNNFLVAIAGKEVLGAVGLERYGNDGLLRSLVVRPESRWTGLGTQLAAAMEEHAKKLGVTNLYLLTMTAPDFFARRGYAELARSGAPKALQETTEFSTLCPSQAVCMHKSLT
jgi:amino-acid N-acetyltransferase